MARSLTTIARELNSACALKWGADAAHLPPLFFMTDEIRTRDPAACLEHLPEGTGIIFRHYQDPDRAAKAKQTAIEARKHNLPLLVAEDIELAKAVAATGLHLPTRATTRAKALRDEWPDALMTAAAHSEADLLNLGSSINAALLSPIFPTQSHKGAAPLNLRAACGWAAKAPCPVYALGGIDEKNVTRLKGTPFCGIAGISFFMNPK
ncbi:MAG: thiamine phosphate synthase [Alphaproteobacteria bacterium]|nr:MAG: thiamine phosphate synthase [Alphaproteobacteria bacterium]